MRKNWTPAEIKKLRNRLKLTQTKFADLLGYKNYQSIFQLEKGERKPSGAVRVLLNQLDEGQ